MTNKRQALNNNGQGFLKQNKQRHQVISLLNERYESYGFEPIDIPIYESYDLYNSIQGTVALQDMVKTIDTTGDVLVLRPDATIPMLKQIAALDQSEGQSYRYYYSLKVFRHSFGQGKQKERTQSGVELLGQSSLEADAELIALAIHSLRDLKMEGLKIELNHASLLNELLKELNLPAAQNKQLKRLLHSKNLIELRPFLNQYVNQDELKEAIERIPLIYGAPEEVFPQIQSLCLTEQMEEDLTYLQELYKILEDYGVAEHIVIDLSLVNPMEYYSGILFQGFVQSVGKPVLVGGRYDGLADQFSSHIPAVGFAMDIESLCLGLPADLGLQAETEISLDYEGEKQREALALANDLRQRQYRVITRPKRQVAQRIQIYFDLEKITIKTDRETYTYQSSEEVLDWLNNKGETQ